MFYFALIYLQLILVWCSVQCYCRPSIEVFQSNSDGEELEFLESGSILQLTSSADSYNLSCMCYNYKGFPIAEIQCSWIQYTESDWTSYDIVTGTTRFLPDYSTAHNITLPTLHVHPPPVAGYSEVYYACTYLKTGQLYPSGNIYEVSIVCKYNITESATTDVRTSTISIASSTSIISTSIMSSTSVVAKESPSIPYGNEASHLKGLNILIYTSTIGLFMFTLAAVAVLTCWIRSRKNNRLHALLPQNSPQDYLDYIQEGQFTPLTTSEFVASLRERPPTYNESERSHNEASVVAASVAPSSSTAAPSPNTTPSNGQCDTNSNELNEEGNSLILIDSEITSESIANFPILTPIPADL